MLSSPFWHGIFSRINRSIETTNSKVEYSQGITKLKSLYDFNNGNLDSKGQL